MTPSLLPLCLGFDLAWWSSTHDSGAGTGLATQPLAPQWSGGRALDRTARFLATHAPFRSSLLHIPEVAALLKADGMSPGKTVSGADVSPVSSHPLSQPPSVSATVVPSTPGSYERFLCDSLAPIVLFRPPPAHLDATADAVDCPASFGGQAAGACPPLGGGVRRTSTPLTSWLADVLAAQRLVAESARIVDGAAQGAARTSRSLCQIEASIASIGRVVASAELFRKVTRPHDICSSRPSGANLASSPVYAGGVDERHATAECRAQSWALDDVRCGPPALCSGDSCRGSLLPTDRGDHAWVGGMVAEQNRAPITTAVGSDQSLSPLSTIAATISSSSRETELRRHVPHAHGRFHSASLTAHGPSSIGQRLHHPLAPSSSSSTSDAPSLRPPSGGHRVTQPTRVSTRESEPYPRRGKTHHDAHAARRSHSPHDGSHTTTNASSLRCALASTVQPSLSSTHPSSAVGATRSSALPCHAGAAARRLRTTARDVRLEVVDDDEDDDHVFTRPRDRGTKT